MATIATYHKRLIEEDIFRLFRCYPVAIPILKCVCFIPIKSGAFIKRIATTRQIGLA